MYKTEAELWAPAATIPDVGSASVAKIYLGVQQPVKRRAGERKNKTAIGVKIKKVFYKFAHTPGKSSSSKHKSNTLAYKHTTCSFNLEALNLQKLSKYSGTFTKDSAFSRKAYPGLDSVQRQVLRLYQRHKMQQLYYPIDGAAIPWEAFHSLVDLTTRKITLKCQVGIQSIFPFLFFFSSSSPSKLMQNILTIIWGIGSCTSDSVFFLIFESFGLNYNHF